MQIQTKPALEQIKSELASFTGTTKYYLHWSNDVRYTEGIRHLAEKAQSYWLIDLVAVFQKEWKEKADFQLWKIEVNGREGLVTMREDTDRPILIRHKLTFTDFPDGVFEFYCQNGFILLKSEW